MDPPNSSQGNKVIIHMTGSDDYFLHPHSENAMACDTTTGCNFGKKAIVVAGGRLDIKGLEDDECPSWTRLQSILPPSGVTDATTGCDFDHDLARGDGSFESEVAGSWPNGYGHHHGGSSARLKVVQDPVDGNKYLEQSGQCCSFSGPAFYFNTQCINPASTNVKYHLKVRYRTHSSDVPSQNGMPHLQLWPGGNIGRCPAAIDGEWVTCERFITLADGAADGLRLVMSMSVDPAKTIDYDDLSLEAVPLPYEITVSDPKAAECWGSRPDDNEILFTNSKSEGGWEDQTVRTLHSTDITVPDKISFAQTSGVPYDAKSLNDDIHMASEVASLSRSIVFDADRDGTDNLHGGHLVIHMTPAVAQHIEGVEIRNFGQQGILGRYPIHFHMSGSVTGSIVRKNVIRESNQRCVVIHGSHNILVEDNVSFDSYGHCYMLEDGGEQDNTFQNNLGVRTRKQIHSIDSTDHEPATLWITNPMNNFIGNVCAGSQHNGIWFELRRIRGDSAELTEYEGVYPRHLSLGIFKDNTAHSNKAKGVTTYAPGYCPPTEALFEGITSYQNNHGLLIHGTCRVRVKGAFFGFNNNGILYFGNGSNNRIEDSTFTGNCGQNGIKFSLEKRKSQLQVYSSFFAGYDDDCGGAALKISSIQPKAIYDMPVLSNVSFESDVTNHVLIGKSLENRNIYIEDNDGSMNPSRTPGFFVNDADHMTAFINNDLCSAVGENGLFCRDTCLRRMFVDTGCCENKDSPPSLDYQMVVTSETDQSKTFTFDKDMRQLGRWYKGKEFDVVLPSDDYNVHFLSISDGKIMIPPVILTFRDETNGENPPHCNHITADSIRFVCPGNSVLAADGMTCA